MKKIIILSSIFLLLIAGYLLYNQFAYTNVLVKFDELEPFEKQMNVYFKGFKIGKTTQIYPNKDFTNTYLKLKLDRKKGNFPSNIKVNIKKKKNGGYVNILYPNDPSLKKLKNNDEIEGVITKDISALLESENISNIIDDTGTLIENANRAIQSLNDIFVEIQGIISDNKNNINLCVKNLTSSTEDLKNMTKSLNKSFEDETIRNSINNIETTTNNIKEITSQIDKVSIPLTNRILCNTNSTVKNAEEISKGINETLKKRMGLFRLLFGKPINNDCQ